ncbi:MAG: hypothetical protein H0Z33_02220 [Bacillaceae bacterium]|nr:hypothetical protein [Bacillaceae bacterium]
MNKQRQWKNPYARYPTVKKNRIKQKGNVAYLKRQHNPNDVRYKVLRLRDGIKQANTFIKQMDDAMDSMITVIDFLEQLSGNRGNRSLSGNEILKKLNHVDFKQIVEILQSPIIQSILTSESTQNRPSRGDVRTASEG